MVVISAPCAATARVRQELMRRPSIEHGAGAALAVVAALLAAGEVEVLAEEIEQRGACVDSEGALLVVDGESDGDRVGGFGAGLRCGVGRDADGDAGGDDAGGRDELAPGEFELAVVRRMFGWVGLGALGHGCLACGLMRFGLRGCHVRWDAGVSAPGMLEVHGFESYRVDETVGRH